jgi:hypothetical protein
MAVHIVLDLDDDNEAKEFVKALLKRGKVKTFDTYQDDQGEVYGADSVFNVKVRAIYKKPTSFCEDQEPGHRSNYLKRIKAKMGGWTRSKNYGWWVDPACKRPTRAWAEGDHWWYSFGTNLLPSSITGHEERGQDTSTAIWYDVLPQDSPSQGG